MATHPWSTPWQTPVKRDTRYDLASLTKVLCTTTLAAIAIAEGRLGLDQDVPHEWAHGCPGATLADVLAHSAGFLAHREYFGEVAPFDRDGVLEAVARTPPLYPRGERAVYSDLGFIVLGAWLERCFGQSLPEAFEDRVLYRLGLRSAKHPPLVFRPLAFDRTVGRGGTERIAPTEVYDPALYADAAVPSHVPLRQRFGPDAHGAVHDDNAFVMGGVAGHAGLFGDAEAVLAVARGWLEGSLCSPGLRDLFWTRASTPGSSRCLGFDGHSGDDTSSAGPALSPHAVGHTGYTGTSLWIDPATPSIYVLLSNRVHPHRNNPEIRAARRRFHEAASRLTARP